jgi:60S ribosomal subunit assembly/export protein LOC1
MAPTRTIKNKHAAPKSGGAGGGKSGGKSGGKGGGAGGPRRSSSDGVSKPRNTTGPKPKVPTKEVTGRPNLKGLDKSKKKKQRVYTEKELGLPQLNMITPVGVTKPKGKKKGKVFVDDKVRLSSLIPQLPPPTP